VVVWAIRQKGLTMFGFTVLGDIAIGAAAFGAGVFYQAVVRKWIMGAESYAASLRAKANAVEAAIKAKV
jgi:hypothetical protein